MSRSLALAIAIAALSGVLPSGSAGARDGGKRSVLVTEHDDARMGAEAAQSVAAQVGVLDDPKLNAYLNDIGRKLLRGLPRRSFKYQFFVVDQLEPNAFALPGGYIFISRGLLSLVNNEDELACVIGHEITHAANRHSAQQQALSAHMNPLAIGYMRAGTMAEYGRDMEREADRGGQMLAAAAGYDPMGMSTFLDSLGQVERMIVGYDRMRTFLDSHPGSQERAASNAFRARELRWKRDPSIGDPRASLLNRIEGMPLGQRPEAGVFQGERFLHPDMDFQIRFPRGWHTSNTAQAVGATAPRGDAVVFLSADLPEGDAREMAEKFVEKTQEEEKIKVTRSQLVKIGSIDSWRMEMKAGGRGGAVAANMTFIPYRGATWRVTALSPAHSAKQYQGRTRNTARSFRPLTPEELRSIHATRMRVVVAREGEDLKTLGARTENSWDVSRTAVYNSLFVDHRFSGGEMVKVAHTEPYSPKR